MPQDFEEIVSMLCRCRRCRKRTGHFGGQYGDALSAHPDGPRDPMGQRCAGDGVENFARPWLFVPVLERLTQGVSSAMQTTLDRLYGDIQY